MRDWDSPQVPALAYDSLVWMKPEQSRHMNWTLNLLVGIMKNKKNKKKKTTKKKNKKQKQTTTTTKNKKKKQKQKKTKKTKTNKLFVSL